MTREHIIDRLRTWLVERGGEISAAAITEDTPIVEQRILPSLQVAHFLLYIEELRGERIDVESLQPRTFRSLATIYQHFFQHFFTGSPHA